MGDSKATAGNGPMAQLARLLDHYRFAIRSIIHSARLLGLGSERMAMMGPSLSSLYVGGFVKKSGLAGEGDEGSQIRPLERCQMQKTGTKVPCIFPSYLIPLHTTLRRMCM